jgi:molybdopterin-containing oxidoreductase family iron-sulfur binding subunit
MSDEMLRPRTGVGTTGPSGAEPAPAGQAYWRSLDQLADSPEYRRFAEREFPALFEEITDPVSRRKFLGLMGATLALTGLAGCRRPLALILPYAKMPEDLLPGVPQHYATVMPFRGVGEGILVRSNEGRPQKIDGNPQHPGSLGASHVHAQASILDLFDPDRSRYPMESGTQRSWDEFAAWSRGHFRGLRTQGGRGLRFLSESSSSPAFVALREEITAAFPAAVWHTYEPIHRDAVLEGSRFAFGRPMRAQLSLDQADVILALDCDFLATEPNSVRHARDFAARRRVASEHDTMNRLYAVESAFSVTGSMADHRLRATYADTAGIALALARELAASHGVSAAGLDIAEELPRLEPESVRFVAALAKDLAAHRSQRRARGRSAADPVQALSPERSAWQHQAGGAIHREPEAPAGQVDRLSRQALKQAVDTLVVLGRNRIRCACDLTL